MVKDSINSTKIFVPFEVDLTSLFSKMDIAVEDSNKLVIKA
tara:strand:+ start:76 stop:198 length:123 start_codon:yes stop_codon:yes gene_type:complete